jgi:outer membrane protein TolC
MKKYVAFGLLFLAVGMQHAEAQQLLCLDSCRAMALRNNKQLGVSQLKQDVAANLRKSARTKYLPHVSAIGSYQYTSEEVSLLNSEQKSALSNLGTTVGSGLQGLGAVSITSWETWELS